jgi:tRNA modification GTPase
MVEDTIAAISTPAGVGGIGIIKISGPRAQEIACFLFRSRHFDGKLISHRLYYGEVVNPEDGSPLDEVLLSYMAKPHSYTREDVVEINCHSGYLVLRKILELVIKSGARLAEPGEFTKRSFLNGRIDLAQAEAVMDLIEARSLTALSTASSQLRGFLSHKVNHIREELLLLLSHLEAHIDFPEESVEPLSQEEIEEKVQAALHAVRHLLETYEDGKIYREGISVIITGKPNVGKSSLLNALLGEKRAIVTPIPGTTRDAIEDMISLKGVPVKVIDTAGIREATDLVEEEGLRVTREKVAQADLVILVIDSHQGVDEEDRRIKEELQGKRVIIACNKIDLPPHISPDQVKEEFPGKVVVPVSALHHQGLDEVKNAVVCEVIRHGIESPTEVLVTSLRHKQALEKAAETLTKLLTDIPRDVPPEYLALDLQAGLESLGEIVGVTTREDILDQIFSRFCIGK